jgi:catechol 2,3-dioxygenase-like lactoylglutathione lyase family enzyme
LLTGWNFSKRIVADVEAAERFYAAMGLKTFARMEGGEGDERTHQVQIYMSLTGDGSFAGGGSHQLILCRFPAYPPPPKSVYPGEAWLCFNVADVEAACRTAEQFGGSVFRGGEDRPEHGVRAAIIADVDGHFIEIVGPMTQP